MPRDVESTIKELQNLAKQLELVSSSLEKFNQRYEQTASKSEAVVAQISKLATAYRELSKSVSSPAGLRNVEALIAQFQQLRGELEGISLGVRYKPIETQRGLKSIFSKTIPSISKKIEELNQYVSEELITILEAPQSVIESLIRSKTKLTPGAVKSVGAIDTILKGKLTGLLSRIRDEVVTSILADVGTLLGDLGKVSDVELLGRPRPLKSVAASLGIKDKFQDIYKFLEVKVKPDKLATNLSEQIVQYIINTATGEVERVSEEILRNREALSKYLTPSTPKSTLPAVEIKTDIAEKTKKVETIAFKSLEDLRNFLISLGKIKSEAIDAVLEEVVKVAGDIENIKNITPKFGVRTRKLEIDVEKTLTTGQKAVIPQFVDIRKIESALLKLTPPPAEILKPAEPDISQLRGEIEYQRREIIRAVGEKYAQTIIDAIEKHLKSIGVDIENKVIEYFSPLMSVSPTGEARISVLAGVKGEKSRYKFAFKFKESAQQMEEVTPLASPLDKLKEIPGLLDHVTAKLKDFNLGLKDITHVEVEQLNDSLKSLIVTIQAGEKSIQILGNTAKGVFQRDLRQELEKAVQSSIFGFSPEKTATIVNQLVETFGGLGVTGISKLSSVQNIKTDLLELRVEAENSAGVVSNLVVTLDRLGNIRLPGRKTFEEWLREEEIKRLKEVPGLLDVVVDKLRKFNLSLKDIESVSIVQLNDEFKNLEVNVRAAGQTISVVGNTLSGAFRPDLRATIARYLETTPPLKARERVSELINKVTEMFARAGFDSYDKLDIRRQMPADITFFTAKQIDRSTGSVNQMTIALNRYGEAVTYTNRRILEFTEAIRRNIVEVFKWSVGATLIYGGYRKISEIIQLAIDNEAKLIQVSIILGNEQIKLTEIFKAASDIAKETGENVNGVIEAYTAAYRAVGDIRDAYERTVAANELLVNALTLSKLSTLSTAEAIDVLSGSLRQVQKAGETTGEAFSRGATLLDMWVTITRKANVDLASLATAFSVVQESAENAGMSLEQLNAVIAVVAEKTGQVAGKELGNIVRALVGNLYTDRAIQALSRYGIAVKSASGEMRDFLDISYDIYTAYKTGLISEKDFAKLAYTLGDGVRNAQRFQLFLADLPRVAQLTEEQADSAGAAQNALAKSLDTVQTKVTYLGNAFQKLANTLGMEGGLLDYTKALLDVGTGLVDTFSELTKILGSLTIPLTLTSLLLFLSRGPTRQARLAEFMENLEGLAAIKAPGLTAGISSLFGLDPTTASKIIGRVGGGAVLGGVAALPFISKAIEGDERRWLSVAGSIVGGIVGGLTGNPIWMFAGATIGGAFVDSLITEKGEVTDYFRSIIKGAVEEGRVEEPRLTKEEELAKKLDEFIPKLLGGWISKTTLVLQARAAQTFGRDFYGLSIQPGAEITERNVMELYARAIVNAVKEGRKFLGVGRYARFITPELQQVAEAYLEALEESRKEIPRELTQEDIRRTPINQFIERYGETNKKIISDVMKQQQEYIKEQYYRGLITPTQYRELGRSIAGTPSAMARFDAVKTIEGIQGINKELLKTLPTAESFADILLQASTESSQALVSLITDIIDLSAAIQASKGGMIEYGDINITTAQAVEILNGQIEQLLALLKLTEQQTQKNQAVAIKGLFPQTYTFEDITNQEQLNAFLAEVMKKQEELLAFAIQNGIITGADAGLLETQAKSEKLILELGEKLGYQIAQGIIFPDLLSKVYNELQKGGAFGGLGYQFLNVTLAQFQSIIPEYNRIVKAIESRGGKVDVQELITFFKDTSNPLNYKMDWKIVQHLLSQILDTEKKQLDGIYNLPSEATAWVPFQSLQFAYQKGLNEASSQNIVPPDFGPVDSAAQNTGNQLNNLAAAAEYAATTLRNYPAQYEMYAAREREGRGSKASALRYEAQYEHYLTQQYSRAMEAYGQRYTEMYRKWQEQEASRGIAQSLEKQQELLLELSKQPFNIDLSGLIDAIKQIPTDLSNFFKGLLNPNPFNPPDIPTAKRKSEELLLPSQTATTQIPQVSTSLKLSLNSNINLVVDGRILANVVKNYLWEDLIKYVNSSTAASQSYTII